MEKINKKLETVHPLFKSLIETLRESANKNLLFFDETEETVKAYASISVAELKELLEKPATYWMHISPREVLRWMLARAEIDAGKETNGPEK